MDVALFGFLLRRELLHGIWRGDESPIVSYLLFAYFFTGNSSFLILSLLEI